MPFEPWSHGDTEKKLKKLRDFTLALPLHYVAGIIMAGSARVIPVRGQCLRGWTFETFVGEPLFHTLQ